MCVSGIVKSYFDLTDRYRIKFAKYHSLGGVGCPLFFIVVDLASHAAINLCSLSDTPSIDYALYNIMYNVCCRSEADRYLFSTMSRIYSTFSIGAEHS